MSDLRQAAQQALNALEGWSNHGQWVWPVSALEQAKRNTTEAITALRDALAAPHSEIEQLKAARDALREALWEYAHHKAKCNVGYMIDCDCGLVAAIDAARGDK